MNRRALRASLICPNVGSTVTRRNIAISLPRLVCQTLVHRNYEVVGLGSRGVAVLAGLAPAGVLGDGDEQLRRAGDGAVDVPRSPVAGVRSQGAGLSAMPAAVVAAASASSIGSSCSTSLMAWVISAATMTWSAVQMICAL